MAELELRLSCLAYDRTLPILRRAIIPKGVKPSLFESKTADESSRGMLTMRFDAAEMSLASFVKARDDGMPLIGLPIFPNRKFLHPYIFCHAGSGIQEPKDLSGRTVGVPQFWMTSSVWQRGLLKHEYGIDPKDLVWKVGGSERLQSMALPHGLQIEVDPNGKSPEEKLLAREIDAFLTARTPRVFLDHPQKVTRPFRDLGRAIRDYHRKTSLFPIMHLVVLKEELWREHPWLALSLCEAFQAAKEQALQDLGDEAATMLPLMRAYLDETRDLFGLDPWPYGLAKNRTVLQTFLEHALEQGLLQQPMELDGMFAENTLNF